MINIQSTSFLRRVLFVDAASSAAMGLLLFAAAAPLASLLSLPESLLRQVGLLLLPFAAFVAWVASRQALARVAVWSIIALNVLWLIDSILLLLGGWVTPNVLGYVFVVGQAAVVGVLAELEYIGLRRTAIAA
jgi:hypothetical protein